MRTKVLENTWQVTAVVVIAIFVALTFLPGSVFADAGEVNTVTGSCGNPVNANQYEVGQAVLLKGKNFSPNVTLSWDITEVGGANPTVLGSGTIDTDENGEFCFVAINSLPVGSDLESPYKATAGGKSDNFSVVLAANNNGTITVVKQLVNPPVDVTADDFSFTVNGGTATQFESDGSNASIQNLNDGPFDVVEVEANGIGYVTTYNGCENIALTENGATCTITNTYDTPQVTKGSITVKKETNDASGDVVPFDFTGDLGAFSVNGDNTDTELVSNLSAGSYTVTETDEPGWDFDSVSCTGADFVNTANGVTVTLDVANNVVENAICTFSNTKEIVDDTTIMVIKQTDPALDQTDFSFTLNNTDFGPALSDGESSGAIVVSVGINDLVETAVQGWSLTNVSCVNEAQQSIGLVDADGVYLNLTEGDDITCTFTNTKDQPDPNLGTIGGFKWEDVDGDGKKSETEGIVEGWVIELREGQSLVATTTTDLNGDYLFYDLEDGEYTVCEAQQIGWLQTYPTENNGCYDVEIIEGNTPEGYDFGNQQWFTLTVTTTGDGHGVVLGENETIVCDTDVEEDDCSESYVKGTSVNLTVTPDEGSNFDSSWTVGFGTCTGNATSCSLTMTQNVDLTAHFALNQQSSGGGGGGGSSRRSNDDEGEVLGEVLGETIPQGAPNTGVADMAQNALYGTAMLLLGLYGVDKVRKAEVK